MVGKALQKLFLLRSKSGFWFRSLVWGGLAALLLNWLLFLSGAGYYRNGQKLQKHYRNFLSTWGVLDWALGGCLFGSWRSLVLVGGALQKLFAVAHLLLRQEKENKLSFYLLLIAKVLLRSKSGFWFRSIVWGAERAEIAESFLASLEIWAFVWVACLGR